jgi:predicted HD phosphohydrolase
MFATYGKTINDSVVTQEEHALQTAALAERAGASDMLVTASLLHDVGHLRGELVPRTHAHTHTPNPEPFDLLAP